MQAVEVWGTTLVDSIHNEDFLLIERLLARMDSDYSAAEADGRLFSLAAMLGGDALPVWLQSLVSGAQTDGDERNAVLEELVQVAQRRASELERGESLPSLCLPDDDDDPRDRVEGLAGWASGFLTGLGEGAGLRGEAAVTLLKKDSIAGLIEDLQEITRADAAAEDLAENAEEFEAAFVELVEFLRVAAQLAYEECAALRVVPESDSVH